MSKPVYEYEFECLDITLVYIKNVRAKLEQKIHEK